MNSSVKRLLALALCILILLGAAACSQQEEKKDPLSSTSQTAGETSAANTGGAKTAVLDENAEPAQDPFGKYDPAIELTTIHTSNDSAFWFPEGDSIDSNIYTRTWEEKLGIKYKFLWTSPGAQAPDKMNIMLSSGDIPDVMSVNRKDFEKIYRAGLVEDLTQPLINYASKYTKKYLTGEYSGILDAVTRDGKYYGIPNATSYQDFSNMLWIRADWLKKLNLQNPKNLTELEAIMEAFVKNDPDGNSKNDTYAIALADANMNANSASFTGDMQYWGIGDAFFNMFHVYPNLWVKNAKGELENGIFGAEYRDKTRNAISKLKEYYAKGYINPDFATYDSAKYQEDLFNDRAGIIFGSLWEAYWPLVLHKDKNPDADWVPVAIPSVDGEPAKTGNNNAIINNILVARKGIKNPEALVKMANLYHDLNNNPETMQFGKYNTDPADNNQIFLAYPLPIYNPSFNYEGYQAISDAIKTGDESKLCEAYKLFYSQAKSYMSTGDKAGWPPYRSYTADGSLNIIAGYLKDKLMQFNEYTPEPTESMIENGPTIKKTYDEMFLSVVMGNADISQYDSFLSQYDSVYDSVVTKEVNNWFAAKGKVSIQDSFDKK